jgi:hypothetical protein
MGCGAEPPTVKNKAMTEPLRSSPELETAGGGEVLPRLAFPSVARYRFELEALDELRLPAYAGSAWRGALGHGLKRAVCVTRQPRCEGCLLAGTCVYSVIFESPAPDEDARRRFTAVPHPFVLVLDATTPRHCQAGASLSVGLNLLGAANTAVPYLIHGLNLAGERGVGAGNGRFRVAAVHQELRLGQALWETVYDADSASFRRLPVQPPAVPPLPERVALDLLTPLRIKRDGRLIGPQEFRIGDLLYHLAWRLAALEAFYGQGGGKAYDVGRPEPEGPPGLELERDLHWREWTRYSSRQGTEMQMGGLVGRLVLDGRVAQPYWPQLWLGQWIHVGKATSMGLGRYRLADAASLPARHAPA